LVVGTKDDSVSADAIAEWAHDHMSAITRANVQGIVGKLATLVQEARGQEPVFEATVIMRPEPDGSWVERIGEAEFRVFGRTALRAVALNDVSSPESLNYIDDRLSKLGVPKLLARAGAKAGDVVWIAEFSFEYIPDM
jgi:GTPase